MFFTFSKTKHMELYVSMTLCRPLSSCSGHRTQRFSVYGNLVVPFARSSTMHSCRPVLFLWFIQQPGMDLQRSKASPKRCLYSIPSPSFPLGLGRERLSVG